MSATQANPSIPQLISSLREARQRTLELVGDLSQEQMMGPRLSIVNPLRWEIGHVAWFQEFWVLRHLHRLEPILTQGDALYDSARVAHDTRWDLPLPSKVDTLDYMQQILDRVIEQHQLQRPSSRGRVDGYDIVYFLHLALFHEYMHAEAITYTRQTLGHAPPRLTLVNDPVNTKKRNGPVTREKEGPPQLSTVELGDVEIPGGTFFLGSTPDLVFVFDNEQWAHPIEIQPFSIGRAAVTNTEFAEFVEDKGYQRRELWTQEGWQWREHAGAWHAVYWQPLSHGRWLRRNFDQLVPLEDHFPVLHVNWYEADAYCRWAGRRLPTEAEWEMAACAEPTADRRRITERKRRFPWGDDPPTPDRANLDWRAMGCLEVTALPAGDSAFGCRQMIGNVWEWTASDFEPYPGFAAGPYKEYSAPWFGDHKVLRGGCWATRSGLIRNTYRNFYRPDRRDVWAGFRTCAR